MKRARAKLAPASSPAVVDERTTSLNALLHELQVHQVELEAQNAELERLKGELESTLESYSVLYQNAPIACLNMDAGGVILQSNRKGGEMLGATPEDLVGRRLLGFFSGSSKDRVANALSPAAEHSDRDQLEVELEPLDREKRPLISLGVTADRRAGTFLVLISDISERRELEQALLDTGQREQLRLAADLHDGLGQELAGICMRVTAMAHDAEREIPLRPGELRQCIAELTHALEECRALARGLSPLAAYQGGLTEALRQHAVHCQALGGPAVYFQLIEKAPTRLTRGQLDHLYRIAQEAVSNARRHSGANSIEIRLDIQARAVTLVIIDDGRGFNQEHSTPRLGLRLMRHRAALMGAQLSVVSIPRNGTQILCMVAQPSPDDRTQARLA